MTRNSNLFGMSMMRFNEKQFYKKFMKLIEIPALGHHDTELIFDIKFYARFLALYPSKMKKGLGQI
jgi:hypothetical protein